MPDELNLDELERLERAATPGPWETRTIYGYLPKDSALIVAVRNALPALLAKIREQAARIVELEAERKGRVWLTVEQARKLEWCASYWHCPACEAPRRSLLHVGAEAPHKGDCWLAAAITKAKEGA